MEKVDRERVAFERDLAKHTAALMDFAKPYIGRLTAADRDDFLSRALAAAWDTREKFVPDKENAGLLKWWNECLRTAARSRREWRCARSVFGARDGSFEMVRGAKLGQELL